MTKILRCRSTAVALISVCFLAAPAVPSAHAQGVPQLAGHWTFNATQSDNVDEKIEKAKENSWNWLNNSSGGPYVGAEHGGIPGGDGPGGMGGLANISSGGQSANRGPAIGREDWGKLAANPKSLLIDQLPDRMVLTDDAQHAETFYSDGKKREEKDANGKKFSVKGLWEGGAFIVDTRLPHAEKITQTFRLSEDGKQLVVTTRFDASSLHPPLDIRRVYDLTKTPGQ